MMTSRLKNALGYGALAAFAFAALSSGSLGKLGMWAAHALRATFGAAAWVVPIWLGNASWRAYLGERRDLLRALIWALHLVALCVSVELVQFGGGWVGSRGASLLVEAIGDAAYVALLFIWLVWLLRMLGPRRVDQLADHASVLSRRAREQYSPLRLLPSPNQTLRAQVVQNYPDPDQAYQ